MRRLLLAALLISISRSAVSAQMPVDLGISNIPQQTPVWCWAAVSQQIIAWVRAGDTPQQCELVAIANGAAPPVCCANFETCAVTGSLQQIQQLIHRYGGRYSSIAPPTDPVTLYNTLLAGRAIVMAVQTSPFAGHVVVIRGMEWIPTPMGVQPIVYVNDPMAYFTQPIPFGNLASIWRQAIVVY